jgi:hypothetical protein
MDTVVSDPLVDNAPFEDVAVGYAPRNKGIEFHHIVDSLPRILAQPFSDVPNLVSESKVWNRPTTHLQRKPPRDIYFAFDTYQRTVPTYRSLFYEQGLLN